MLIVYTTNLTFFIFIYFTFFVVNYSAVPFGSQYYLKVCFLTMCSPTKPPTLDNMIYTLLYDGPVQL